jgi:hypothetical protein
MLAILQGQHTVIRKACRTTPDDDIAVRQRYVARSLRAADAAK